MWCLYLHTREEEEAGIKKGRKETTRAINFQTAYAAASRVSSLRTLTPPKKHLPHPPHPSTSSSSSISKANTSPPRYAQQQQLYNAQAQAAAAAAVQRGNQQLQQQVQQQAQQQAQAAQQSHLQQQQNLLGLINRNAGNVSAGLVGRPINIGPGVVQNLGLDGRPIPQTAAETQIRDVWAEDLNREMGVLRSLVDKFPYIAMVS